MCYKIDSAWWGVFWIVSAVVSILRKSIMCITWSFRAKQTFSKRERYFPKSLHHAFENVTNLSICIVNSDQLVHVHYHWSEQGGKRLGFELVVVQPDTQGWQKPKASTLTGHHIALNFRGSKFSQIVIFEDFVEIISLIFYEQLKIWEIWKLKICENLVPYGNT